MRKGTVAAICIADAGKKPMRQVFVAKALEGAGLEGDRYCHGTGSYQKATIGNRQVTLINALFVRASPFSFTETRRNIATDGIELMELIGKEFDIGAARMRGIRYCDPCLVPSVLAKKKERFNEHFHDRGGLIAEIIRTGFIEVGDNIIPPTRDY